MGNSGGYELDATSVAKICYRFKHLEYWVGMEWLKCHSVGNRKPELATLTAEFVRDTILA